MLTAIIAVTLSAPDLAAVEHAYTDTLEYRVLERGLVSRSLAEAWDAGRSVGHRYMLMQPASGEPVYLRVVETPATPGYAAMKTHGWNSNEILVQDVDAVAKRVERSPFRIVGEPRPLSTNPSIKAMQAIGPSGELIYLTQVPPGASKLLTGTAHSFVDRTFIVVLGGPDMEAMRAFYREVLGNPVTEPMPAEIRVLNHALGVAPTVTTPLALVQVSGSFLIELDAYPPQTVPRPRHAGELPPGMSMVSFAVPTLEGLHLPWLVAPKVRSEAPYGGRKAALLRGAAGELIELVATDK